MIGEFGQLQFERQLAAQPDRVFEALISPQDRMAWGPPDVSSVVLIDTPESPAPGGRELSRVGPRENPYVDVATDWVVIEPSTRLIYAETLSAEGAVLATSLATYELAQSETGTDLRATIHLANFAGPEMMPEIEGGWTHAFDALAAHVTVR